MFKKTVTTEDGILYHSAIEEVVAPPSTDKKLKTRLAIEEQVFDIHDSVADNAKWASILTTLISRIYSIIPTAQKDLLDPTERATIEYALAEFAKTNTRADIMLAAEGVAGIKKLLDRQGAIGTIVG